MSPTLTFRSTVRASLLTIAPLFACAGCVSEDDGRVQQLLNQRGFGTRYVGDTNEQYYLGVGDVFAISDALNFEFNATLKVRSDGVIDPPVIKEIFVAGLTIPDLEEMLTQRYREYNTTADISAEMVTSSSKWFYIDGKVALPGRKAFEGETTLFRAVFDAGPTLLSDADAVRLIRADPYHPLAVEFDYDDMLQAGWSLGNVEVRENDIIYVPPNVFGYLTDFTEQVFSPLTLIVNSMLGVNRLLYSVETFGDTSRFNQRGRGGFYGYVAPSAARPLLVATSAGDDGSDGGDGNRVGGAD